MRLGRGAIFFIRCSFWSRETSRQLESAIEYIIESYGWCLILTITIREEIANLMHLFMRLGTIIKLFNINLLEMSELYHSAQLRIHILLKRQPFYLQRSSNLNEEFKLERAVLCLKRFTNHYQITVDTFDMSHGAKRLSLLCKENFDQTPHTFCSIYDSKSRLWITYRLQ